MTGPEEIVVPVVLFIAVGAVLLYFLRRHYDLKREQMLAETALRKLEMEKGYPPGTYSRTKMNARRWQKAQEASAASSERIEREDLEKGIRDLRERMANIDTIVSRKGEGK